MINRMMKRIVLGLALGLGVSFASQADAAVILEDRNSKVVIDPSGPGGMHTWEVDGVDHLASQWFFLRVGDGPEVSLDELDTLDNPVQILASDGNGRPGNERVFMQYTTDDYIVEVDYLLTGGQVGSKVSDVAEIITIINLKDTVLDISLFQYSDFDLGGTIGDDTVRISGGNTAQQHDSGTVMSETVVTPLPTHFEVALFSDTLDKLTDGDKDDLNDFAGPLGPGDGTWAFQWDFEIGVADSVIVSKDKGIAVVPEPATMSLLGLAAFGLIRRRTA